MAGYSARVVGWTGYISCMRRLNFHQLLLGQAFRLRFPTNDIDLRPVEPSKLLGLDEVRASLHLEASREPLTGGHHILAWLR